MVPRILATLWRGAEMKILIIPANPGHVFLARGYQVAKHLAEHGDQVHFLTWDPYPRDISSIKKNLSSSLKHLEYGADGVMVHKVPRLPFFFPPVNGCMFRKLVSQISEREGLDVIISATFLNEVEPPFDLPLVYDLWDHWEAYYDIFAGRLETFGVKYILNLRKSIHTQIKHAAAITAVSNVLVDYAKRINPDVPVYKIPNGVDTLFLDTPRATLRNEFGEYSMVYVGSFGGWSNLLKLIQATSLLTRICPAIKLVLVGEGPEIPGAKELVKSLRLTENVVFLGLVPREKVPGIINGCEIALCPRQKNLWGDSSFPIKVIEYTALGKKIVSSNVEEVTSLGFPNITLYDDSKGVEELANGIMTAFNTDIDQNETRKLAYRYTWKDMAQQFHSILQKTITQRKG